MTPWLIALTVIFFIGFPFFAWKTYLPLVFGIPAWVIYVCVMFGILTLFLYLFKIKYWDKLDDSVDVDEEG